VVFRAIPYGRAARFAAAVAPDPWDGVRDCTTPGPACPQAGDPGSGGVMGAFDVDGPMDEDCLTLDVWTPAPDDAGRPTVVWVHGGGFRSGSGSCPVYDGDAFVRDGVVLVTLNYRLHAFGFLYLDELFAGARGTGNLGLGDQVAALEWVRTNIARFGGDPDNVTVCGESAGAMSVGALLGSGAAAGLCRRAVAESGAGHHVVSAAAATRVARRVLELVSAPPGDWDALRDVPAGALVHASTRVAREAATLLEGEFSPAMAFQPVVDGVMLRERPVDLVAGGAAAGVGLLVGTCADELRIVAWGMPDALQRRNLDPAVRRVLAASGRSVDEVAACYPPGTDLDCHLAMETDYRYAVPAAALAEAQLAHAPVWMYRFTWPTPVAGGLLGACHALEVPFVFDTGHACPDLVGSDPPRRVVDAVHGAWVAFARAGDPGWAAYDATRRPVMELGAVCGVVEDPDRERREVWQGVLG